MEKNKSKRIKLASESEKRVITTSISQIAEHWIENSNIPETELNFDWAEAHTHCWNCGDNKQTGQGKKVRLERCHIVPHALGGLDEAANYVLLCNECHREAPDCLNPKYMWEWIKSNKTQFSLPGFYKIEKALMLFERRRGIPFFTAISKTNKSDSEILQLTKEKLPNISSHSYFISVESHYALLCEIYDSANENK